MSPWYRSAAFWGGFRRGMLLGCLLYYPPHLAFLAYHYGWLR